MTTARDILVDTMKARGLPNPEWEADTIINRLDLAGYVILPTTEVEARERAAREAGRIEALEEAAGIADTFEDWGDFGGYLETASGQIASRIRALKGAKP